MFIITVRNSAWIISTIKLLINLSIGNYYVLMIWIKFYVDNALVLCIYEKASCIEQMWSSECKYGMWKLKKELWFRNIKGYVGWVNCNRLMVFNVDEWTISKVQLHAKRYHLIANKHAENSTIVACVNRGGYVLLSIV